MSLRENQSASSSPLTVNFNGWRHASEDFKSWAGKMAALHEPTWRKAGIFDAVMSSTTKIHKDNGLLMGISEKWCPETNTFVFPWGETTITLEDVMVLLNFSVLGLPVFATLDTLEKKRILRNLEKEWKIMREGHMVTQVAWMGRFMNSGDELEHVAFLALWVSYFVFPTCYYRISRSILPIAVHLSFGTKLAIAPAVLAHLYTELTFLKYHMGDFTKSPAKVDLGSLFKLVQVWTWERFKELQPKPDRMVKDDKPRLDRWLDVKHITSDVKQILDNSEIDNFVWRPYTIAVGKWKFPKFYPEKEMTVPVGPNLDDEFLSFARCISVSQLAGIEGVQNYFPDRVASQFGMLQDIPAPVNQNSLSPKAAWNDYNKPISYPTLYIPSRFAMPCFTQLFCEWWRRTFPQLQSFPKEKQSAETLKSRNKIGDDPSFVPSGSKVNITSKENTKVAGNSANTYHKYMLKQARDRRNKYMMKRAREDDETTMGHCQTQAQKLRLVQRKNSGEAASEQLGKTSRLESDNNDPSPLLSPPDIEERNEETNETGKKTGENMFQSSDAPLGAIGGVVDIGVSPPETRQTCTFDFDLNKEPDYLLHEDGAVAGEKARTNEKLCIEAKKENDVVDDDSLIQKRLAMEELALKACSSQKLVLGGANFDENLCSEAEKEDDVVADGKIKESSPIILSPSDESNIQINVEITVDDGNQRQECLVHENGLGSEEDDAGNDSYGKSFAFAEGDGSVDRGAYEYKTKKAGVVERKESQKAERISSI